MSNMRQRWRKIGTVLVCVLAAATSVWACSVPVFRYALERWPADAYQAIVFHRGELTAEQQAAAEILAREGLAGEMFANVQLTKVDLDAKPDPALLALWQPHEKEELPFLVVRYPLQTRIPIDVWSGPLTAQSARSLLDSPQRREIARRLLKGETAVWVFLESGDQEKDDPAFQLLTEQLSALEKTLKLPEIEEADLAQGLVMIDPDEMRIKFSTLRLARDEPAEQLLVHSLLGTEADLRELKDPMAFPLFGRGRALYALVGAGINENTIAQAGADLTGPCTCTIKDQNPGTDLLMAVDWDRLVEPQSEVDKALPPLAGLGGFGQPLAVASAQGDDAKESNTAETSTADGSDATTATSATAESNSGDKSDSSAASDDVAGGDAANNSADTVATADDSSEKREFVGKKSASSTLIEQPVTRTATTPSSNLMRNIMISSLLLVIMVVFGSMLLVTRRS